MERETLARLLGNALSADGNSLALLLEPTGFREPKKSAENVRLLQGFLGDISLLADLVFDALAAADPDQALNNLERLCGEIPSQEMRSILSVPDSRRSLLTILGASGFLSTILFRHPSFLIPLLIDGGIDIRKDRESMEGELREAVPSGSPFEGLQKGLRLFKQREILRIASRDLCGMSDLQEVTAELSSLAAASLQCAYEVCNTLLRGEYGAPMEESGREAEFTVFGMGKFGGWELNFSSDIDLIYFYSTEKGETAGVPGPLDEAGNRISLHVYFVRLGEMISKAISQPTEDGFVFRVDMRLRPEGNNGEMANSVRSAEVYYESWGQSWERAAMIKARPVAGSIPLGNRLLKSLEPFIYRRYLDYGMIEDIKGMKQKIDGSLARKQEGETNLKLGRGGIREIEFFIQALQLIYAGKNPALRQKSSLQTLDALLREGLIRMEEHGQLTKAYVFLRTVEHRIQVVQERQTHNLPTKEGDMRNLARRCGFTETAAFRSTLENHRAAVEAIYRDLFYTAEEEIKVEVRPEISFLFDPTAEPDFVKDMLEERGFRNPDAAYESLAILRDGPPHAHLTEKARRQLERIAPLLMQEVVDSPEPEMALLNLERFLVAVRARGTFYALLAENREIIKLLVSLFGTSQFLSRIFIQHPEILDTLVSRSYAVFFKEKEAIRKDFDSLLQGGEDYEEKLDVMRRFRKEEFLRIALNDIHGQTPQGKGTEQLSSLAEVCLEKALEIAREELLPRFGLPVLRSESGEEHEAPFIIVGMGKLGGGELNYHSDLDIIFIFEGEGENRPAPGMDPDRFRSLSIQEYFSKLAQRIISVLTLMTREGAVYQIDTRLRPSGNQGSLVTSLVAFERYHHSSAQVWERQALIKAKAVAGDPRLAARFEALKQKLVYERSVPEELEGEIVRLRNRMEVEIAQEGEAHFNIKTGRGGMVDVEFLVQYLQLIHGGVHANLRSPNTLDAMNSLFKGGLLSKGDFEILSGGYKFLRRLENKLRLVHDQSISELSGDPVYLVKLARRLGYPDRPKRPDVAFLEEYKTITQNIRAVFDRVLKQFQ